MAKIEDAVRNRENFYPRKPISKVNIGIFMVQKAPV